MNYPTFTRVGRSAVGWSPLTLQPLPDEPVFHLFSRPRCLAQKREAGFHRGIELETADRDPPTHLAPAVPLDQLIQDALQRNAMERITRM